MTIIKPPSFDELVRLYGSKKAAILHLLKSGYTAEDIAWKMSVSYFLVRLYMSGIDLNGWLKFSKITEIYERLALMRSKKGKETELVKFFQRSDLDLEVKTRLVLGRIVDESLKIGPGLIERALSTASGADPKTVKKLLIDYGEYGEVASLLLKSKQAKLTLEEVYESIRLLPKLKGVEARTHLISSLLEVSTPQEGKYIVRLLLFDLKLGYYQRTVIHAAARAYNVPADLIESVCAIVGLAEGIMIAPKGSLVLKKVKLLPGQFVKPQLAHLYQPEKVEYPVFAESKLDGSRLQIHKWGTRVWLFSRRGIEKTEALPEVVEIVSKFRAQSCIVDSELIATDQSGEPLPFQLLLERTIPKKLSPQRGKGKKEKVIVTLRAFDIVFLDGRELGNRPFVERREHLSNVVPSEFLVENRKCHSEVELMGFYEETLHLGYEGIVVKNIESPYEFGRRTHTWLKFKSERDAIDCTLIKAFYGKGKRAGLFSSFLMAVRDPTKRKLYTIGKVSNLPDKTLEELKQLVEETKISHDELGVFIKPSIVVEVTYQEIQLTDEYTSNYALRVPKIIRFRSDKSVEEVDTLDRMKKLYEIQYERQISQTLS
ncbi:MAG: ATP-dependent DNA ligase [Candidatus Bathyarchaeota archaeon]|nr:MAG: ATP-dependent DNA ligase [Candidatus Bathyarchaeota archaeon]